VKILAVCKKIHLLQHYLLIYIYICNLATYFGSLVTQLLANLDVFVYPNRPCRRTYNRVSLKMTHDLKHVANEKYEL
jgi:hypothetical protein